MSNLLHGNITIAKGTGADLLLDFVRDNKDKYDISIDEIECTVGGLPAVIIKIQTWLSRDSDFSDAIEKFIFDSIVASKFDGDVMSVLLTHDYGTIEEGSFGCPFKSGEIEYGEELEYNTASKEAYDGKIMSDIFNRLRERKYSNID